MSIQLKARDLALEAEKEGLLLVSSSPVLSLSEVEVERLKAWQAAGYQAEMSYMERAPSERADATHLESQTKTLLSFAIPYAATAHTELPIGFGRVARYALGKDYHRVIKKRLQRLGGRMSKEGGGLFWRPISDSFPLLERAFAREGGLGFIGKNTMLIRKQLGSFFFLGEVLTDLEVLQEGSLKVYDESCGSCSRCLEACPTNAFPQPFQLDSRRCISYLTIEKRTAFSDWESRALGEWIFGCDICQKVCPFNHSRMKTDSFQVWEEFQADQNEFLELAPLFSLRTEEEFRDAFSGRAILRAKREGLLRNALSVLGNTGAREQFEAVKDLALKDSSEIVRIEAQRTGARFQLLN